MAYDKTQTVKYKAYKWATKIQSRLSTLHSCDAAVAGFRAGYRLERTEHGKVIGQLHFKQMRASLLLGRVLEELHSTSLRNMNFVKDLEQVHRTLI